MLATLSNELSSRGCKITVSGSWCRCVTFLGERIAVYYVREDKIVIATHAVFAKLLDRPVPGLDGTCVSVDFLDIASALLCMEKLLNAVLFGNIFSL